MQLPSGIVQLLVLTHAHINDIATLRHASSNFHVQSTISLCQIQEYWFGYHVELFIY